MQQAGVTWGGTRATSRMDRRRAMVLAGTACTLSGLLRAQPPARLAHVGFLAPPIPEKEGRGLFDSLRVQMQRLGWTEGSRVQYVLRLPGEVNVGYSTRARMAIMARELVSARVDLIVAMSTGSAVAAKSATETIPIVFLAERPVENGLVASLARPGGNVTGFTFHIDSLSAKRIQLLTQAVPAIRSMAYLCTESGGSIDLCRSAQSAGKALHMEVSLAQIRRAEDFDEAFNAASHADAWIVDDYPLFLAHMGRIVNLIAKLRKPAVYSSREWVDSGGLMSYSDDRADWPRQLASLADRILRGAKPAELPVAEPTRFLLVINKTARAHGIMIAPSLMLQADEVLE